jgi:hypothetical protein
MNTGTIFDLFEAPEQQVQEAELPGKPDQSLQFMEMAAAAPASREFKEEEDPGYLTQIGRAGGRGIARSIRGIGDLLFNTLGAKKFVPEFLKEGIPTEEEFEASLQEQLPSQDTTLEKFVERFAPMAAIPGGGWAGLGRSALAAGLGQATEELGGGPTTQAAAEILGLSAPSLAKKLIPSSKKIMFGGKMLPQKEVIEKARAIGMTEEQIAPLIQTKGKQALLSGFAGAEGKIPEGLSKSQEGIGSFYNQIKDSSAAQKALSPSSASKLTNKMNKIWKDLGDAPRGAIRESFQEFTSSPKTGEDMIRFYKKVNEAMGPDKTKTLKAFKMPLKDAINTVSPSLAKDFNLATNLYERYASQASKINNSKVGKLMKGATEKGTWTGLLGLITGNHGLVTGSIGLVAGAEAAKKLSKSMLTNPRFQNLSSKMISSLNSNKIKAAESVLKSYTKEMQKEGIDPSIIAEFNSLDFDEILEK